MRALKVIIERGEGNYSAYLEEVDGVITTGSSIDEIKANMIESIETFVEGCEFCGESVPEELKGEYELIFRMDVESVLNFYKGVFTKAGIERLTGINQKQLWQYSSGGKAPRQEQVLKIEAALHKLGQELIAISL